MNPGGMVGRGAAPRAEADCILAAVSLAAS